MLYTKLKLISVSYYCPRYRVILELCEMARAGWLLLLGSIFLMGIEYPVVYHTIMSVCVEAQPGLVL